MRRKNRSTPPYKKFCNKQFRVYNPNLLSSPLPLVLFLSKIFTFYIPERVYAHIREVKKSERESLERLKERESVCIYYSSFSERKEVKSNTIYIIAERNDDDEFFTDGVLET